MTGSRRPGVLGDKAQRIHKKNMQKRLKKQQRRAATLIQRNWRAQRSRRQVMLLHKMRLAQRMHTLWTRRPGVAGYEVRCVKCIDRFVLTAALQHREPSFNPLILSLFCLCRLVHCKQQC